ncbi:hypothetical protein [Candidatus Amarolinea aalborgensis]
MYRLDAPTTGLPWEPVGAGLGFDVSGSTELAEVSAERWRSPH